MNKARKKILLILLSTMLLVSCAGQPPASPTPDMDAILTQSIGTLSASFFLTQTAILPTATNTPVPTSTSLPTNTPLALPSPLPSATQGYIAATVAYPTVFVTGTQYTPTTNPSSQASGCNNLLFIQDVTLPTGTELAPGQKATKTWQVSNNGTCDWTFGYRLVPVSGTNLADDPVKVTNPPVPPGEWRKLSVGITAPKKAGTYTQYWQLTDGAGKKFGSLLGISIVVKDTASYP